MKTTSEKHKWVARDVKTECNSEGDASAILLPVTEIDGVWYAYTKPVKAGQRSSDYLGGIVGIKEFGEYIENCVEVPFHYERLNLSSGRVIGSTKGVFQIPQGEVELSKVTGFY